MTMVTIIECAFRSILISCGLQFVVFQLLDMAVIRQRSAWPAYLYMVAKTFLLSVTSQLVVSQNSAVLSLANIVLNMLITVIVYFLIIWTWNDDALHTLLIFIIAEPIAIFLTVFVCIVNYLEGRPVMELTGPIQLFDLLIPVIVIGGFYLLYPIFQKVMRFIGKLYFPHRKLLWLFVLGYFLFSHIPAFAGNNIGEGANGVLYIQYVIMSASFCIGVLIMVSSQALMIQKEKDSIDMQLRLINKRAEITSRIRREIEESRRIIGKQMEQMELLVEKGSHLEQSQIESYIADLHQANAKEYRGIYCTYPLVDETLCEIQESAEAKGLQAHIFMSGYLPGTVAQEDLAQLLYCIGFGCEGNAGIFELTITTSGENLIIRLNAPRIRLTRMRSILANHIVHSYRGSLVEERSKGGRTLYVYLKN